MYLRQQATPQKLQKPRILGVPDKQEISDGSETCLTIYAHDSANSVFDRHHTSMSSTVDESDRPVAEAEFNGEDLQALGYESTMSRKFSFFSMLCLAYAVLGTWSTFAQDLGSGLEAGHPIGILYGLVVVFACNICIAMSLGEICSSMPTALGQAYWVSRLWPTEAGRILSYIVSLRYPVVSQS